MNMVAYDLNNKPYNKIVLVIVMLVGVFCVVLNQTILATAYPTIMNDFNINIDTVEWLTTAFLLVNGIVLPFSAILMKKFNSKYLFITTISIFTVGTIICALSGSFIILLIGRIIQAIGVGVAMPLLQTSFLNIFTIKERGVAMGFVGLVIALAPSIGPTLSGYVVDHFNWHFLFIMILPILIIDIIACFIFLRQVIPLEKTKFDLFSAFLSLVGFGGLLYGFSLMGTLGFLNVKVLGIIGVSVVIIILFSIRQFKIPYPFLRLANFKYNIFTISVIVTSISYMALLGFESTLPLFLQKVRGETAFHSGILLLPGALIMGVMSPITGIVFDKYGARNLSIAGLTLLSIGTFSFMFISDTTPLMSIMILYAIRLFGISMVLMPISTSGLNQLPNKYLSDGTAINNTIRQIASSIGTAILVSTLSLVTINSMPSSEIKNTNPFEYLAQSVQASIQGYQVAFLIAFVLCILALFFSFRVPKNTVPAEMAKEKEREGVK